MLVVLLAAYAVFRRTGVFALSASVQGAVGLGAVFLTGVVAAGSTCLAVVGGLLLSVSAKWADARPNATRWQKLEPLLLFNTGRILGYAVLGGLVGFLGTAVGLSSRGTGYLTILVSAVMLLLGLNILRLVPKKFCTLPLSRRLRERITHLRDSHHPAAALALGAFTFFLPCGFTQSMQLLALASGNAATGAAIMATFALGTLPALVGISLLSSLSEGAFRRVFLSFSGTLVLLLGVLNLQSGLTLAGVDNTRALERVVSFVTGEPMPDTTQDDPYVSIAPDGRQVVTMYIFDDGYSPGRFTIRPGVETWVYALAPENLSGCANFLTAPAYNLTTVIKKGANWLGPIINPQHDFLLTCSMGRLRADVHVQGS